MARRIFGIVVLSCREPGAGSPGCLPDDLVGEDFAVGGVARVVGGGFVLDAELRHRAVARVAQRTPAGRRNPYDAPLAYGEDLPVHLEFARPAGEEVEFLVISVDMQETAFRSGHERLEREFAAGGLYGCAAEHLSGNFHSGTEFHNIVVQLV